MYVCIVTEYWDKPLPGKMGDNKPNATLSSRTLIHAVSECVRLTMFAPKKNISEYVFYEINTINVPFLDSILSVR